MQQVAPASSLRIVYLIADHTDSTTYYVQSVVRDSVSGAILKTIQLTDTGDRRFFGTYQTPPTDEVYIDITTTVYTDSGYTTKASNKYEELQQYFVKTQWGLQFQNLGGEKIIEKGSGIDYEKLRKIVREEMKKVEKIEDKKEKQDDKKESEKIDRVISMVQKVIDKEPEPVEKPKPVDLSPVIEAVRANKTDLSPVLDMIAKLSENTAQDDSIDFTPVMEAIKNLKTDLLPPAIKEEVKKTRVLGGYRIDMPMDMSRVKNLM